jgi:hypothetical protein
MAASVIRSYDRRNNSRPVLEADLSLPRSADDQGGGQGLNDKLIQVDDDRLPWGDTN